MSWNDICFNDIMFVLEHEINRTDMDLPFYKIFTQHGDKTNHSNTNTNVMVENKHILRFPNNFGINFNRTIRVPDDGKSYPLPPHLGSFTIDKIGNNFVVPMYQREAMWMSFYSESSGCQSKTFALKVGIGNINAITGEKWQKGVLSQNPQNYVVCPKQPWLDGIKINTDSKNSTSLTNSTNSTNSTSLANSTNTVENLVRQFVATNITDKSTIEQQLLEQGKINKIQGGLQFELFELFNKNFKLYCPNLKQFLDIEKSPNDYNLSPNTKILFMTTYNTPNSVPLTNLTLTQLNISDQDSIRCDIYVGSGVVYVKTLTGKTINVLININMKVEDLKRQIQNMEGIHTDIQRLIFQGLQLEDYRTLHDYNITAGVVLHMVLRLRGGGDPHQMGISAGGLIVQKIYTDNNKLSDYNLDNYTSCKVNITNSLFYFKQMPTTPITAETYMEYKYPWYTLYDEDLEAINKIKNSMFNSVKSIGSFDNNDNECSICMENYANMEYLQCRHQLCMGCFAKIVSQLKEENRDLCCHLCRSKIDKQNIKILSALTSLNEVTNNIRKIDSSVMVDKNNIIKLTLPKLAKSV
ncbi:MAG: hypothetical protein Homavirus14_4 [Homavirus sp.]|uniref:Ubiquitin n=1 Tax=Homavirus sp. TaxID=2487769 RepID=A0A3G5A4P1_9VIRU|nr:MAG: hypothetical protein Homavirus14_4 [Homavirus sp.]